MEKQTPKCIGIILDGNRRFARERGLPTFEGHRRGFNNLVTLCKHAKKRGIKHLVVYAFSTENWNRMPKEISYLMGLFRNMLTEKIEELKKEKIAVKIVGQKERFSTDIQRMIENINKETEDMSEMTAWACLSYGGRAEIVAAAQKAARSGEITEETLTENLWTAGMPDPDIIIRTGKEKRLSNFLLWQVAYSELFFSDTHCPAFSTEEFDTIIEEYAKRERRKGR